MKKYLLLVVGFSLVLFGCKENTINEIAINKIVDLPTLQSVIIQVSEEMNEGRLPMEQAQHLVDHLQQRYLELTDTTQKNIEVTFDSIQQTFDDQSVTMYGIPLWAKKIGMIEPQGMSFATGLSQQIHMDATGYVSTILVYTGEYDLALQQAKLLAQHARLHESKNFQQAQSLANVGNLTYISGLDIGSLRKGVVYVNHELLETNIDHLLSVSVDQDGVLTIEATRYKNN